MFVSHQGNPIPQAPVPIVEEINAESVASKWGTILGEVDAETKPKFNISVLKVGGLTTANSMPYAEEGAIDRREAINSMTNEYLLRENKYNPMFLAAVKNMGAHKGGALLPQKALSFQGPTSRGGNANELHKYAPGWTSLFYNGTCMIAKPVDVCKAINYAVSNMPEYGGIEVTLIDGESSTIISLDELEDTNITMLLPPTAQNKKKRKYSNDEVDELKAEIAAKAAEIERLSKLVAGA